MKHKLERIKIAEEMDIAKAVFAAESLAKMAGCSKTSQCMVATAVSELATNIFLYALRGEVCLSILERRGQRGIEVIARDEGPGIKDIPAVMGEDFISAHGLGLGLKGVNRLMDEFIIDTKRRRGTKITARKWFSGAGT
jgi:serine/threonine-protein kinase RsbT